MYSNIFLVSGGRDFPEDRAFNFLKYFMFGLNVPDQHLSLFNQMPVIYQYIIDRTTFVFGDCLTGADKAAEDFCQKYNINYLKFEADWKNFGKSAGPIRNKKMLDYLWLKKDDDIDTLNRVEGIIFQGGKGTENMKSLLEKSNIDYIEISKV